MEIQSRPGNGTNGVAGRGTEGFPPEPLDGPEPIGYLTTESLAALWEKRRRDIDRHRRAHPDDLKEIERRQRVASQLFQTFRVLADLEQQLGIVLGLPVLRAVHPPLAEHASTLHSPDDLLGEPRAVGEPAAR